MTVSNVLAPAVIYADRFMIGGLLSLTAVAFYTAPFDMLTRLWLVPAALISVLFPAFAATLKHEPERTGFLLARGVKYVLMAMFPLILVAVTLSPEILRIWLGGAFEHNSADPLRWLAVGIFFNCLAHVPLTLIQSAGRPEITAKLLIVEFPFYWAAVWLMTVHFGITGAAMAWTARAVLELGLLLFFASRLLPQAPAFLTRLTLASVAGLVLFSAGCLLHGDLAKAVFLAVTLAAFALTCWRWGLSPAERLFLLAGFGRAFARNRTGADSGWSRETS
jgi:O-antigen/teichoic acid export membrane protein